jgi:hypothetical protein
LSVESTGLWGGGRHCSGSGALPLSLLGDGGLPQRGLALGWHGGVVADVGSSVVGGGVGVGVGVVVVVASVPPSSLSEM